MGNATPNASIVVLTYNELENATRPCIDSILANTDLEANELILVDNASEDGTGAYLEQLGAGDENIRVRRNATNRGYAGGNNDGMHMARGRYIVLLNNDTLVPPEWLDALLGPLRDGRIGLAGPLTNSAGNEQRIELPGLTEHNFAELAHNYGQRQKGVRHETGKLGFFCVAMPRTLPETIGYLDEDFGIGMFEDDDFCLRTREGAGKKLVIVEDCFVYHKGSLSFKKLELATYHEIFDRNRAYFFSKHRRHWTFSDLAFAYWQMFAADLADYTRRHRPLDPAIERIQVRFENYRHLLVQVQNAEIGRHAPAAKPLTQAAAEGRRQVRKEVFQREFLHGTTRQRGNYLRAVLTSLVGSKRRPAEQQEFDISPLMEAIRGMRASERFRKVVVFPPTIDFHWMKQRPQQLARAFAKAGCLVIYGTLNHREDNVGVTEKVEERLYLLHADWLYYLHHALHPQETLYYCLWPNNGKFRDHIGFSALVYDYMDELSLLDLPPGEAERMHMEMLEAADLITVSADRLLAGIPKQYREKTLLVGNGVEEAFIAAAAEASPDAEIAARFAGHSVVGYFGAMAEWLDFELVSMLATEFSGCTFLFIGPVLGVDAEIEALRADHPNLHFWPPVPHSQLPSILAAFDACIIPFLVNDITNAVSPVKLFEYMSAGKPIVTTRLQECMKYPGVSIAGDYADFRRLLKQAMERPDRGAPLRGSIATARDNTWEKRVAAIEQRLGRCCGEAS